MELSGEGSIAYEIFSNFQLVQVIISTHQLEIKVTIKARNSQGVHRLYDPFPFPSGMIEQLGNLVSRDSSFGKTL